MDKRNHPLLIHCNHGKHRAGIVVACTHISHRWHRSRALADHARFSHPKERKADISFINEFIAAAPT
ncbi:hypothetical protein BCR37DRAFT_379087 [Protomyces lactucae-debilis]|uniref:Tyrosine specific protein phosphatases domain-containing protein n=1 Tax=Protomyces lactucae-debilis TaxID=2754530 RepID=A0A1Y2FIA1_PROLT|nr:uncharacterized protein BCR37DRAFT_379087 [Protomyces lactucae-debilis]ORY83114.1 hypothetical protein BCR37DRAFT_379087 [Protomyces lactucae-debilis]